MVVHIPIGELAIQVTMSVDGREYWICVDQRIYEGSGRPYYVYTIYHNGYAVVKPDWKHTAVHLAIGDAAEEIIERWWEK